MQFVPALIVAGYGLVSLAMIAVANYQTWRKEGSLQGHARAIVAAVLSRLAVLLVAIVLLLAALGRTAPIAFLIFVLVLALASTVLGVSDAIQRARNAGEKQGPNPMKRQTPG